MKILVSELSDTFIELREGTSLELIDDTDKNITLKLNKDAHAKYTLKTQKPSDKTLIISLEGQGASADIKCFYESRGSDVTKIKTIQHHKSPDTISNLTIKGVLHDSSKLFCNNLIRIDKDAQRVRASEQNKNLLLGPDARVVTIPKLEVEADDVSAQHGAAISRIDETQLFYLQSRGLNLHSAKKLLIEAFLNI